MVRGQHKATAGEPAGVTATPSRGTALVRFELIDGTLRGRLQLDSHETASFDNEAELVSALIARARRERHRSQMRVVVEPAATVPRARSHGMDDGQGRGGGREQS